MALGSLVVIRAAAPDVYDQALRFPPSWPRWAGIAFLLALAAFIALLAVGVLRRWHWTFWLILVAFLAGVLRVPVAILQLTGICARAFQAGTSCSRGSLDSSSSPSGWPCWPATGALASGEPAELRQALTLLRWRVAPP